MTQKRTNRSALDRAIFTPPVRVEVCERNPKRLVIKDARDEVLLRTLDDTQRDRDMADFICSSVNESFGLTSNKLVKR